MISHTKCAVIGIMAVVSLASRLAHAANTHNLLRHLPSTHNQQPQERFLEDSCLDNLSSVAEDGTKKVTAQEFLAFILLQSGGRDDYLTFSDLPLDLRVLFYATACSGGQDCTTLSPTISLDGEGMVSTLLQIFCAQVEQILEQPTDSLKVSFQYSLYYGSQFTLEEIMARVDDQSIVSRLETATERIVSNTLGCPLDSERRYLQRQHDSTTELIHVQPSHNDESLQLSTILTEQEAEHCTRELQDCHYAISAVVDDMIEHDCDPPAASSHIKCAIVGSSVMIEGDEISDQERMELRAQVIKALSDAVNDGSFEDHLP